MRTITKNVLNDKKKTLFETIQDYAKSNDAIVVARLHKVRAAQLMSLKKSLTGQVIFAVAKNRIAAKALKDSKLVSDEFLQSLKGQNVIIFTNMDPFKLCLILRKNVVSLAAKAGDIASDDVLIASGNTGIPAGPVLSDFREVGIPTRIDTGNIWVSENTVAAKKDDIISPKLAAIFSSLGLTPIRSDLSISKASWDGLLLNETDVQIDLEECTRRLVESAHSAFAVAVNAQYLTSETCPLILSDAKKNAIALAVSMEYPADETVALLLTKGEQDAAILHDAAKSKGYN